MAQDDPEATLKYPTETLRQTLELLAQTRAMALYDIKTAQDRPAWIPLWVASACRQIASNFRAFSIVAEAELASVALGLVRSQIDVAARTHGLLMVSEPVEIVELVVSGKKLSDIRDNIGNKMHDGYLFDKLVEDYSALSKYLRKFRNVGCANVHFSNSSIFRSSVESDVEGSLIFRDLFDDAFIDEKDRDGAHIAMETATLVATTVTAEVLQSLRSRTQPDENDVCL